MKIARSLAELGPPARSVVTIGNFDGVHCGHRSVIAAVRERAQALQARSVVLTFDPHPTRVLEGAPATPLLTPLPQKLELLKATGVDLVLVLPFTEALRTLTARQFAAEVLCDALGTVEIHEGETFRFGHRAEADIRGLTELGHELGFKCVSYQPLMQRGGVVSSSRIRTLVSAGEMDVARALLGRPYSVNSTPSSGRGYGTRYAVPTINLAPYPELLPAHGVYITTLRIDTGPEAKTFAGVTNAGNRPTFGADSYAVESHLFDFEPLALTPDTSLRLSFLHRLRGEQRFATPDALKQQIGKDVARAQRYLQLARALGSQAASLTAS